MNKYARHLSLWISAALLFSSSAFAQVVVRGVVKDGNTKEAMIGVSVLIKGEARGSITDIRGKFAVRVAELPVTLSISYVGYATVEKKVDAETELPLSIELFNESLADDRVKVGSRFNSRSLTDSPVPVDVITAAELRNTGQTTLAQALTYTLPAFNSTQQYVSDATAHFDPTDIRGLGPSRLLLLINGKRKNASALTYTNDTPGKGEVGPDWRSIPLYAVERVEVLRDGASAQYGSDAIAGVINIILKDGKDGSSMRAFSGVSQEGDGVEMGYGLNTGFRLGNSGQLMVNASFHEQRTTNRPGEPGEDRLFGVGPDNPWIQENPSLGMEVGQPYIGGASLFFNSSVSIDTKHEVYGFGGLSYRKGISAALYRTPYWIPDPFNILHDRGEPYQGFLPSFEIDLQDRTLVLGTRGQQGSWEYDISLDWGGNRVDYLATNTLNPSLGQQSPTRFDVGGYEFGHVVSNIDMGRSIGNFNIAAGTELRREVFVAMAGHEQSYIGAGAQSFPGLRPENEVEAIRYNVGGYVEGTWNISRQLLAGAALRFERYSDFGNSFTWQLNARYTPVDWLNLRGSASTGFRAPTLHQTYFSSIQSIVSGGSVSKQGTFNNLSPVVRALDVPRLKEENSLSLSGGIAINPNEQFSLTADYYRIQVDDRVVFTGNIGTSDTTTRVGQVLQDYSVNSLKFFTNAISTVSSGLDLVANYSGLSLGKGSLDATLSANFSHHGFQGSLSTPSNIREAGMNIFDRKEQSRVLTGRPSHKIHLRLYYKLEKWQISLLNTRFGAITWQHAEDPGKDQTFTAKTLTDLRIQYQILESFNLAINCNNALNVYPNELDAKGDVITDLGGRFRYGWDMNQFGVRGRFFSVDLNLTF